MMERFFIFGLVGVLITILTLGALSLGSSKSVDESQVQFGPMTLYEWQAYSRTGQMRGGETQGSWGTDPSTGQDTGIRAFGG